MSEPLRRPIDQLLERELVEELTETLSVRIIQRVRAIVAEGNRQISAGRQNIVLLTQVVTPLAFGRDDADGRRPVATASTAAGGCGPHGGVSTASTVNGSVASPVIGREVSA